MPQFESCQKCGSARITYVSTKSSDRCSVSIGEHDHTGYIPKGFGIGEEDGDYLEIAYCMDCGQMQGEWPLPITEIENKEENEDEY